MSRTHRALLLIVPLLSWLLLAASPAHASDQWALLVGVTDYKHVRPLRGCVNDVTLMKKLLITRFGFRDDHIVLITNAQATRKGIEEAFRAQLIARPAAGDRIVFYYSGHGTRLRLKDGQFHEAILPVDVDKGRADLAICDALLSDWIGASPARDVLVVLDSCHSGSNVKSVELASSSKSVNLFENEPGPAPSTAKALEGYGKTTLLAACKTSETAADSMFQGADGKPYFQGVFTYALATVLEGCDTTTLKRMSYSELMSRVNKIVRGELEEAQTPVLHGSAVSRTVVRDEVALLPEMTAPSPRLPAFAAAADVERRLSVQIEGDDAATRSAVCDVLAPEPWLSVVSGTASGDRRVRVEAKGTGLNAVITTSTGTPVAELSATTASELAQALLGELRRTYAFQWLSRLTNPSSSFHVEVSPDRGENAVYQIGEKISFTFRADRDCHVVLLDVGPDGEITVLYPNAFHPDSFVKAGETVRIPDDSMTFDIKVGGPKGREMVKVIATLNPIDTASLAPREGSFATSQGNVRQFRRTVQAAVSKGLGPMGNGVASRVETPSSANASDHDWADASTIIEIK